MARWDSKARARGFGLYLVDTLVEMYGGEVRLTDNEPEGSIFTVELHTDER